MCTLRTYQVRRERMQLWLFSWDALVHGLDIPKSKDFIRYWCKQQKPPRFRSSSKVQEKKIFKTPNPSDDIYGIIYGRILEYKGTFPNLKVPSWFIDLLLVAQNDRTAALRVQQDCPWQVRFVTTATVVPWPPCSYRRFGDFSCFVSLEVSLVSSMPPMFSCSHFPVIYLRSWRVVNIWEQAQGGVGHEAQGRIPRPLSFNVGCSDASADHGWHHSLDWLPMIQS